MIFFTQYYLDFHKSKTMRLSTKLELLNQKYAYS